MTTSYGTSNTHLGVIEGESTIICTVHLPQIRTSGSWIFSRQSLKAMISSRRCYLGGQKVLIVSKLISEQVEGVATVMYCYLL